MTNQTFLRTYPKVKSMCLFEFIKSEGKFKDGTTADIRDFRITTDTAIRNAFLTDFAAVRSFYISGKSQSKLQGGTVKESKSTSYKFEQILTSFILTFVFAWLLLK